MRIVITENDIKNGEIGLSFACPIALSLQRQCKILDIGYRRNAKPISNW